MLWAILGAPRTDLRRAIQLLKIPGMAVESGGFLAETLVHVPHGVVAIEQIRVGDLVLSLDLATGASA